MRTPQGIKETAEGFWVLEGDTHLSEWIGLHKRLDVAKGLIDLFKDLIPKGGTVVDAGASLGDHTATYAELVGPEGRVLAFEPHPLAFMCLFKNMERYPWVKCHNRALGAFSGMAMFQKQANAGASFVLADGMSIESAAPVGLAPLDDYIGEMGNRLDFIHLDAEGFESFILTGALKALEKFRPPIVMEINHECLARQGFSEAYVIGHLKDLRYDFREMEAHNGPSNPQRDIVCIPK